MKRYAHFALLLFCCLQAYGQSVMRIHRTYGGVNWNIPLRAEEMQYADLDGAGNLQGHFLKKDGSEIVVPYSLEVIDSIDFALALSDEEKGHNKYRVFAMYIDTEDHAPIDNKDEWLPCHISVDGMGEYSDYSGTGRIRGRGNSSWLWYDKKPYKFKLDAKSKLLGLEKAKDWNLLANYRDVTDLMNVVAFEAARYMGMPNTLHTRFVEVFLNGEYNGIYQLTEKIEVDDNRLNLNRNHGILLTLDQDDGPSLSPDDGDNFWTEVYDLPMAVKYPDEPTAEQLTEIKADFAQLENAIRNQDYQAVDSLMDLSSFISMIQLHEYLYNVEIDAPRSMYLYRDSLGKYTFGPVWDWDAGYDFDWSDMYTGHRFFSDYTELILGTDPYNNVGASYHISGFFTDLFANKTFVARYKQQWDAVKDSLYLKPWTEARNYQLNRGAYNRESDRWPIEGESSSSEIKKMQNWLKNRLAYLNDVIANYPNGSATNLPVTVVGTIDVEQYAYFDSGYSQWDAIYIDEDELKSKMGVSDLSGLQLKPLNADGSLGSNTANGTYGAWFDADGNTVSWGNDTHVFIESNDLYSWSYGCHPSKCAAGHTHTVTMQYRLPQDDVVRAVNVKVKFIVE